MGYWSLYDVFERGGVPPYRAYWMARQLYYYLATGKQIPSWGPPR